MYLHTRATQEGLNVHNFTFDPVVPEKFEVESASKKNVRREGIQD